MSEEMTERQRLVEARDVLRQRINNIATPESSLAGLVREYREVIKAIAALPQPGQLDFLEKYEEEKGNVVTGRFGDRASGT